MCVVQVYEARSGFIMAAFSEAAATTEGDITAYMNELVRLNAVSDDWLLSKTSSMWAAKVSGCLLYSLRPPWVPLPRIGSRTHADIAAGC